MTQRSSLALLWGGNAVLALAVLAWWQLPSARWQAPAAVAPDYASALNDFGLPGQLEGPYSGIIKAPLFEATRQWPKAAPPPPQSKQPPKPEPEPPKDALDEAKVLGIYEQAGQSMVILQAGGRTHRLRIGQSYEGWTLRSIDKLAVRLTHAQRPERTLYLKRRLDNPPAEASAPAQAPRGALPPAQPPNRGR